MHTGLIRSLRIACVAAFVGTVVLATGAAAQTPLTLKDRIEFGVDTSSIVRKYDIKVKTQGTTAILTGTVATDAQKAEAARLAKVAGAVKIQNDIVVDKGVDVTLADRVKTGLSKTGDKITDAWITTKVKWYFWGEEGLKGSDINVDTMDRVVTLKGTVKTVDSRTRAVALANGTEGVRRVVDQLTIGK